MKRHLQLACTVFGAALLLAQAALAHAQTERMIATASTDTVHVAPPKGDHESDRGSIVAALEQVHEGGTVQFAPGTYLVGRSVEVAIPRVTLVGHPNGTTLRGCDPAAFKDMDMAVAECNGLNLTGGYQTVRDLTFEYAWHALALGVRCEGGRCPPGPVRLDILPGGYLVEGNTFRESQNGVRVVGQWREPAVIRDNRFINTYHAVMVNGMTAHVLNNDIVVPEPERVPTTGHPGLALLISGWAEMGAPACDENVIAGNRIEGHPAAIWIMVFDGGTCRDNEIRDNTIKVARVGFDSRSSAVHVRDAVDSTVVGVPLALLNGVLGDGLIEQNVLDGNRVLAAEGVAIEIVGASGNRVVSNTITGVTRRDPFPGNTLLPDAPRWGEANGSGIWVSPGSDDNEIRDNAFEEIAGYGIMLEGNRNIVETRSASDSVRDLGSGSRVTQQPEGQ